MEAKTYTVSKEQSLMRIDKFLCEKESELSRSRIQQLMSEQHIKVK